MFIIFSLVEKRDGILKLGKKRKFLSEKYFYFHARIGWDRGPSEQEQTNHELQLKFELFTRTFSTHLNFNFIM